MTIVNENESILHIDDFFQPPSAAMRELPPCALPPQLFSDRRISSASFLKLKKKPPPAAEKIVFKVFRMSFFFRLRRSVS